MSARMLTIAGCAAALLLAACGEWPFGYTSIRDIVAAPAQFEGKEVKLKGTVTGVLEVPIVDLKGYTLRDDTGEIAVTTRSALPAEAERVALRGVVRSAVIVGGRSVGLHVEEVKRY